MTAKTVTVDRKLLRSLIIEAQGVIETMERLAGCTEPHVVQRLSHLNCEVAQATGILPSEDEYLAWSETPAAEHGPHPLTDALWDAGERRRDEILGYKTQATVADTIAGMEDQFDAS